MKSLEQRLQVTEKRLRLCYEDRASYLTKIEEQLISDNARLHVCTSFAINSKIQPERTQTVALTCYSDVECFVEHFNLSKPIIL